jgi:hypothetical protein
VKFKDGASRRVVDMPVQPLKSDLPLGAGAPVRRPIGWDRRGVADDFIGLEKKPVIFGRAAVNQKNKLNPEIAIGVSIGAAGGDDP